MKSTCTICGLTFEARHSYGLCPSCFSRDRARELDRVESTIKALRRKNVWPLQLTLVEWLSTISDFMGMCAFCREYQCNVIELVSRDKGLVYDNVVPACRACSRRRQDGYEEAEDRVRVYLTAERVQHFIPSREEIEPA
jgi:hypothetical protein